jgi:DNA-binding YbaB/EbfC family protein
VKDVGELMKQAAAMQARMKEAQDKLAALEVEGVSGGGMVKIALNGKGYVAGVAIDRTILKPDEGELLEDLIAAAINDARAKLDQQAATEMKSVTAGLALPPGMKLPF